MIESYRKLYELLDSGEKRNLIILVGVMMAEALMEMVGVGIIPVFITIIAFPEQLNEYMFFDVLRGFVSGRWLQGEHLIYTGSSIVLIFFIVKNIFIIISTYLKTRYAQNRSLNFSKRLFSNYLGAPYAFHLKHGSTELIRNINSECALLSNRGTYADA